jgi:hypothetical protein
MDAIVKNGTIGAASGAIPGWISSVASFVITKELVARKESLNLLIALSFIGGSVIGAAGGFIGGAIGGKNAARNGLIGGTMITPAICAAIIIDDKLTKKSAK